MGSMPADAGIPRRAPADAGIPRRRAEGWVKRLDAAFEGDAASVIANLATVREEDWTWLPPGGARSIRELVQHIGSSKLLYADAAFADGNLGFDDPIVQGEGSLGTVGLGVGWLRAAHAALRAGVATLDDAAFDAEIGMPFGRTANAEEMLDQLARHEVYHTGEINHLRALAQDDDAWAW